MVHPDHRLALARGLLKRGLVRPLRWSELIVVVGKPLFNGMFGFGVDAFLPDTAGVDGCAASRVDSA